MTALVADRAVGLLREFSVAGVLQPADVHVATRLGAIVGETDPRVLLAVALTVRGTRHGSVVLDLATAADTITVDADDDGVVTPVELPWPEPDGWLVACRESPVVAEAMHLLDTRLWLDRYWRQEEQVAQDLLARAGVVDDLDAAELRADLDDLFREPNEGDQRTAVAVAALSRVSVIAGGPGTGKTTAVARLVAVLARRLGPGVRVALAAPTGKAAARLEEAVHAAGAPLSDADRAVLAGLSASTVHRLLGRLPGSSSRFRHDRHNRLPVDVVIVDESSMVSLTLMARLLEALGPRTRLVLVGDPDQLASVEAGAVLGDLVAREDVDARVAPLRTALRAAVPGDDVPLRADGPGAALASSVAVLRTIHRYDAGGSIARLAELVRAGDAHGVLDLLRSGAEGLVFDELDGDEAVRAGVVASLAERVVRYERALIDAALAEDVDRALDTLDRHRLLCAHRAGPRGVQHWGDLAQRWVDPGVALEPDGSYAGLPLLVTANDYETGLFNGDTGIAVRRGDELVAAFRRGARPIVVPMSRLDRVRPMHAMTVHRAQGSQFETATVVLPLADSPLATRQTFYTAVTRAAREVRLVGSADSVRACVARPAARATGLRARLR